MKYKAYFVLTGTLCVEVEANSIDEATDKAWDNASVHLCHQCAKDMDVEISLSFKLSDIIEVEKYE